MQEADRLGNLTSLKAVSIALKNEWDFKKAVGILLLAMITPFLMFAFCFMEIMSAFETDGVLMSPQYVEEEQTTVFGALQEAMQPYYEELRISLAEKREETIALYTTTYERETEVEKQNGKIEIKTETIIVKPTVIRKMTYIPENLMIAYLLLQDGMETKTGTIDKEKLSVFLSDISSIICRKEQNADGTEIYWVENKLLTVSEIAEIYFSKETDKTQFLLTCEAYGEYFDTAQSVIIFENGEEQITGTFLEQLSEVPLYLQYDSAWGTVSYGNGTIKRNGCCPTCLAMVFSYFRGETIYPNHITAWSGNNYYVNEAGTAWSIFQPAGEQWGVPCTNIGKDREQMQQALSNGKLIIASMGPGTFTKGGHFIVLTGITETGKIRVNDPNDSSIKKHSQMEFAISLILRECKNMWVFG